ncbi:MAG: hypothetical protein CMB80_00165, partial [Flammeovirgaceae bacterium]|nr:hypothetical protein [Flammeovirgaceae bacterium]
MMRQSNNKHYDTNGGLLGHPTNVSSHPKPPVSKEDETMKQTRSYVAKVGLIPTLTKLTKYSGAGCHVYESNYKVAGNLSRNRKYCIEKVQYPSNIHYYPRLCGVVPMNYTWIVSVVEINDVTGEIFFLKNRNSKACARKLQSPNFSNRLQHLEKVN